MNCSDFVGNLALSPKTAFCHCKCHRGVPAWINNNCCICKVKSQPTLIVVTDNTKELYADKP